MMLKFYINKNIFFFSHLENLQPYEYLTVATSPTLMVTGSSSYWKSVHVDGLKPGGSYS